MKLSLSIPALILLAALRPGAAQDLASSTSTTSTNAATDAMPLREVVLFSSGVGYFGRAGEIRGATTVPLQFRAEQVNDVLKSLVLFDATGGVRPVTFATKDAASRRQSQSLVSVESSASLGQLLRQFQGAAVRLTTADGVIEGRILSVQTRAATDVQNRTVQFEVLNVLTEGGLKAVPLDSVSQVALLDERLNRQLQENLAASAAERDDSKRVVSLHFDGNARRTVRAGYLLEAPVWKTSYRLVLDAGNEAPPFLQGWGLVENTTDDDWKGVKLSLVSGRPISFIQDLYQPLYIARPVVAPQVIGSPTPQLYGQRLDAPALPPEALADAENGMLAESTNGARRSPAPSSSVSSARASGARRRESNAPFLAQEARGVASLLKDERADVARSLAQTASQAQGSERGELFEYAIAQPVSLAKNQAALVPILSQAIGGERVSIFSPSASEFVLSGFRLRNNSKLHLAGGPVSVIQDGVYAGDAQIGNVGPNDERLISYAVDGEVVAGVRGQNSRSQFVSLSAKAGVLTVKNRLERSIIYTFKNNGAKAKKILVLQPIEEEYALAEPTGKVEKTAQEYRIVVDVPAGKSVEQKVVLQRPLSQTIALLGIDLNTLVLYAREATISPALREALQSLVAKRRALAELQNTRRRLEAELVEIDKEQTRIRGNMEQLDRNSALYQQYVAKLSAQEKRVEEARAKIRDLQAQEDVAQKQINVFVDALNVE